MRIPEQRITLKDGRVLSVRSAEETDAETMLDYVRATSEETHFLIHYPEEISFSLERERQLISDILHSDDTVWFTVFDGGRAVGNCSVSRYSKRRKERHRASFAIAIEQAYCGAGLGTQIISMAIAKAKEMGFRQLELGVYADNERAIALYRKMGFSECGRLPGAFRLKDGTYIDEITMVLIL